VWYNELGLRDTQYVREATLDDIMYIASNIREEDREEIKANCGLPPELAFLGYHQQNREMYVAGMHCYNDADVLFGCDKVPGVPEVGIPWLVSTPRLYEHPQMFLPYSKKIFDYFNTRHPLLTNYIDARNTRHIEWLRWLGCKFLRVVDNFGAEGRPFIEFVSIK